VRSLYLRHRWLAAFTLLLGACATVPPPVASWPERRAALQDIGRFGLAGRVAVAAGSQGFSAGLRWTQRGELATVELSAPLGIGAARVEQSPSLLRLRTSRGVEVEGEEARELLRHDFGFDPPLESLRYWLLGVGDPASPAAETLDDAQRLAHLEQGGWSLDYGDYRRAGSQWLPRRLTLRRGEVRVRLLVRDWRLGS